jgi:hypothetical protein
MKERPSSRADRRRDKPARLFFVGRAEQWGPVQSENDDFFAGRGADVVMKADDLDAGNILNHDFHERPSDFDQMGPHLFEKFAPLFARQRFDHVLFGGGEDALEPHDEQIFDQVSMDVLGAAPHVFLFKARHSFTNGGFNFTDSFHWGDILPNHFRTTTRVPHGKLEEISVFTFDSALTENLILENR